MFGCVGNKRRWKMLKTVCEARGVPVRRGPGSR